MNINELMASAYNGDKDAMLELGQYYRDKNTYEDTIRAATWFDKAADEHDSSMGIKFSMLEWAIVASVNSATHDWATAIINWKKCNSRSKQWLQDCELLSADFDMADEIKLAKEYIDNSSYQLALCYYATKDDDTLLSLDIAEENLKARILRGVSHYYKDHSALAINDLKYVETDAYKKAVKNDIEDGAYCLAACALSELYRTGTGGLTSDLSRSVYILETALSNVKTDFSRNNIQDYLKCYQKKLFGGYKYIG